MDRYYRFCWHEDGAAIVGIAHVEDLECKDGAGTGGVRALAFGIRLILESRDGQV